MAEDIYNYRSLTYLVDRCASLLRNNWIDPELRKQGLTSAQFAILSVINRVPGMSSAELARHFFVTPQTMGSVLTQLESRGFIIRSENQENRRLLSVSLTEKGDELLCKCRDKIMTIEKKLLEDFDQESLGQFKTYLNQLYLKGREEFK